MSFFFALARTSAECLVGLLEAHGGGGDVQAAQLAGLFEDDGGVAALLEHERALHAADAAADDGDLLRLRVGTILYLLCCMVVGVRAQRARCRESSMGCMFGVPLDFLKLKQPLWQLMQGLMSSSRSLQDLVDPLRVDEVLAGDAHGVETSGGDLFGGLHGVHAAGADDRAWW